MISVEKSENANKSIGSVACHIEGGGKKNKIVRKEIPRDSIEEMGEKSNVMGEESDRPTWVRGTASRKCRQSFANDTGENKTEKLYTVYKAAVDRVVGSDGRERA